MSKKGLITLIIGLSMTIICSAQQCGTLINQSEYFELVSSKNNRANYEIVQLSSTPIRFQIIHHIFLNDQGDPNSISVGEDQIDSVMNIVNQSFTQFGIEFISCRYLYHNNSYYNYAIPKFGGGSEVASEYNISNAINVYYSNTPYYCGSATLPTANYDFIDFSSDCIDFETMAHEFGHYFGLLHTHGSLNTECSTNELADGSNCSFTGDLICDTPADPMIYDYRDINCNYTGVCVDANGDFYNPDEFNLMSYSKFENCRNSFSSEQIQEMTFWAEAGNRTDKYYQDVSQTKTVGPTLLCINAQATYSLNNLPAGTSVTWTKSSNLKWVGSRFNPTVTVEYRPGYPEGNAWVRAALSNSCNDVVLDKLNLWIGTPKVPLISGPTLVAANTLKSYQTYPWPGDDFSEQGITGYQWSFPTLPQSGWQCYQCNSSSTSVLTGTQSSYVSVKLQNSCGWSQRRDHAVTVEQDDCPPRGCEEPFFVYPNPATGSFIVEEGNTSNTESETGTSGSIQVFNSVNQTILQSAWDNRKVQIDTKSWPKGTYYVKITRGNRTQTSRLIVE